ncbi:MAG TPA: zinc ribbon domain-containing protein [Bacillota bacterium]|nr:zinc ribbon domain-containing protein [Bacillota bacterium]HPF42266.1 zinc ribbon domain-containing protein [Bacillota bacterium]HPJ86434.1 zinc ribbon domain-containing protein [Bacillota bacterium]HPQ61967.1 zinc ribbon domain-containing protein [Bacillota bacterium]
MPYCSNCGAELKDGQQVCLSCGTFVKTNKANPKAIDDGKTDAGFFLIGFFVPLAGLILYLLWREEKPKEGRSAGKGALVSVIVSAALGILWIVIMLLVFPFAFGI